MGKPQSELERELAEEIRSAIRRLAPENPESPSDASPPDPVRLAEAHLTPSVPEGARLAGVKKGILRALRLVWRDQAAFNALTLEGFRRARQDWEGRFASFRDATERALSEARRRAAVYDARFAELESRQPSSGPAAAPAAWGTASPSEPGLPPAVYSLFEERFRGDPKAIAESQRFFVDLLRGAPGPVLDAGCGRGEFLGLLREEGIPASGVESNPVSVRLCRAAGLDVVQGDAPAFLAAARPGSFGAVVAFQVVEHGPAAQIFAFLAAARRAVAAGGTLVAETVNTDSLSALRAFFLDPTHVRPVPPAALAFLAEAAGFADVRIEYRSPLPPEERLVERGENDARLNRLLFGPQDYAVIARVPGA